MTLHLRTRPLTASLVAVVALLALAGWLAGASTWLGAYPRFTPFAPVFDLGSENNVPTWFSTLLFAATALALALVARRATEARERGAWRWWLLAAAVAAGSLLEDASLAERSMGFLAHPERHGLPPRFWSLVFRGTAILAALLFAPLLAGQPRARAARLVAAGLLAVVGHAGFGWLSAWVAGHGGTAQAAFVLCRVAEESSKMLGVALLLQAALEKLGEGGELRVVVS